MPADDLALNVRQIAGYGPTANAPPSAALLIQLGGLGGPYASINPQDLVSTALATGGDMAIAGALTAQSVAGGSAQFSNGVFGMFSAQKACIVDLAATWGTIAGVPIATVNNLSDVNAAIRAASVWSFNGRLGDVRLWIDDIICAGGAPIFSPRFQGSPRACTPPPESNSSRIATTEFVANAIGGAELVVSFNGRTGAVVLEATDVTALALPYAPIDSPNFTGYATSITPPQGTSTGQIATTAFVMNAVAESVTGVASFNGRTGLVVLQGADLTGAGGALLASPVFIGTPAAPTAVPGTNTTQLATTAYVMAATGGGNYAPINSPAFTGTPTGPTAGPGNNTTQLATTAFVIGEIAAVNAGVISFNGRNGDVTLLANDISAAGGATLQSPIFTGLPSAPTAGPGNNTTQLATTQFVTAAIAALPPVPLASTTNPLMNGAASPGVSAAWSRGDHVHPTDTTRAAQASLASYLPLAGGTLTGQLNSNSLITTSTAVYGGSLGPGYGVAGYPNGDYYLSVSGANGVLRNLAMISAGGYYWQISQALGTLNWVGNSVVGMGLDFSGNMSLSNGGGGSITIAGAGYKPGGGSWAATSDARIKTVEGEWTAGLAEVIALRPVSYTYKGNDTPSAVLEEHPSQDGATTITKDAYSGSAPYPASQHAGAAKTGKTFIGLVAQEVETIIPAMVTKRKGFIDGVEVDDLRELDATPLIFALVNAVKTLTDRVTYLEGVAAGGMK